MSYLTQYATRRPASIGRAKRGARVDERLVLNRPGLYGDAHVRVVVENTSGRRRRFRGVPPSPRLRLRIADCVNEINLEFSVESAALRENSLFKIDTLLGALHRFRDGLAAEAELYARRETALVAGRSESVIAYPAVARQGRTTTRTPRLQLLTQREEGGGRCPT